MSDNEVIIIKDVVASLLTEAELYHEACGLKSFIDPKRCVLVSRLLTTFTRDVLEEYFTKFGKIQKLIQSTDKTSMLLVYCIERSARFLYKMCDSTKNIQGYLYQIQRPLVGQYNVILSWTEVMDWKPELGYQKSNVLTCKTEIWLRTKDVVLELLRAFLQKFDGFAAMAACGRQIQATFNSIAAVNAVMATRPLTLDKKEFFMQRGRPLQCLEPTGWEPTTMLAIDVVDPKPRTEEDLTEHFHRFGEIEWIRRNSDGKKMAGELFSLLDVKVAFDLGMTVVKFKDYDSVDKALSHGQFVVIHQEHCYLERCFSSENTKIIATMQEDWAKNIAQAEQIRVKQFKQLNDFYRVNVEVDGRIFSSLAKSHDEQEFVDPRCCSPDNFNTCLHVKHVVEQHKQQVQKQKQRKQKTFAAWQKQKELEKQADVWNQPQTQQQQQQAMINRPFNPMHVAPQNPSERINSAPQERKLFVGRLSEDTTRKELAEFYSQWGHVTDCLIRLNRITKKSRGFGFVLYSDPNSVTAALQSVPHTLRGNKLNPQRVVVPQQHQERRMDNVYDCSVVIMDVETSVSDVMASLLTEVERYEDTRELKWFIDPKCTVVVSRLLITFTDNMLQEYFGQYGRIKNSYRSSDKTSMFIEYFVEIKHRFTYCLRPSPKHIEGYLYQIERPLVGQYHLTVSWTEVMDWKPELGYRKPIDAKCKTQIWLKVKHLVVERLKECFQKIHGFAHLAVRGREIRARFNSSAGVDAVMAKRPLSIDDMDLFMQRGKHFTRLDPEDWEPTTMLAVGVPDRSLQSEQYLTDYFLDFGGIEWIMRDEKSTTLSQRGWSKVNKETRSLFDVKQAFDCGMSVVKFKDYDSVDKALATGPNVAIRGQRCYLERCFSSESAKIITTMLEDSSKNVAESENIRVKQVTELKTHLGVELETDTRINGSAAAALHHTEEFIDYRCCPPVDFTECVLVKLLLIQYQEQLEAAKQRKVIDPRRLFICKLSPNTTDESLGRFYSQWGRIIKHHVVRGTAKNLSRGYAFVTYADPNSAGAALRSQPHRMDGVIVVAKPGQWSAEERYQAQLDHQQHTTVPLQPSALISLPSSMPMVVYPSMQNMTLPPPHFVPQAIQAPPVVAVPPLDLSRPPPTIPIQPPTTGPVWDHLSKDTGAHHTSESVPTIMNNSVTKYGLPFYLKVKPITLTTTDPSLDRLITPSGHGNSDRDDFDTDSYTSRQQSIRRVSQPRSDIEQGVTQNVQLREPHIRINKHNRPTIKTGLAAKQHKTNTMKQFEPRGDSSHPTGAKIVSKHSQARSNEHAGGLLEDPPNHRSPNFVETVNVAPKHPAVYSGSIERFATNVPDTVSSTDDVMGRKKLEIRRLQTQILGTLLQKKEAEKLRENSLGGAIDPSRTKQEHAGPYTSRKGDYNNEYLEVHSKYETKRVNAEHEVDRPPEKRGKYYVMSNDNQLANFINDTVPQTTLEPNTLCESINTALQQDLQELLCRESKSDDVYPDAGDNYLRETVKACDTLDRPGPSIGKGSMGSNNNRMVDLIQVPTSDPKLYPVTNPDTTKSKGVQRAGSWSISKAKRRRLRKKQKTEACDVTKNIHSPVMYRCNKSEVQHSGGTRSSERGAAQASQASRRHPPKMVQNMTGAVAKRKAQSSSAAGRNTNRGKGRSGVVSRKDPEMDKIQLQLRMLAQQQAAEKLQTTSRHKDTTRIKQKPERKPPAASSHKSVAEIRGATSSASKHSGQNLSEFGVANINIVPGGRLPDFVGTASRVAPKQMSEKYTDIEKGSDVLSRKEREIQELQKQIDLLTKQQTAEESSTSYEHIPSTTPKQDLQCNSSYSGDLFYGKSKYNKFHNDDTRTRNNYGNELVDPVQADISQRASGNVPCTSFPRVIVKRERSPTQSLSSSSPSRSEIQYPEPKRRRLPSRSPSPDRYGHASNDVHEYMSSVIESPPRPKPVGVVSHFRHNTAHPPSSAASLDTTVEPQSVSKQQPSPTRLDTTLYGLNASGATGNDPLIRLPAKYRHPDQQGANPEMDSRLCRPAAPSDNPAAGPHIPVVNTHVRSEGLQPHMQSSRERQRDPLPEKHVSNDASLLEVEKMLEEIMRTKKSAASIPSADIARLLVCAQVKQTVVDMLMSENLLDTTILSTVDNDDLKELGIRIADRKRIALLLNMLKTQ